MRLGLGAAICFGVVAGCGLRSDPLFRADTEAFVETDGAVEGEMGTCSNPIELPGQADSTIEGSLHGLGLYEGSCAEDGAREEVYRFVPATDVDVSISFDASATEFDATIRVLEGGCLPDSNPAALLCDPSVINGDLTPDTRHFFARAGVEYYIIVDAPTVDAGAYVAQVTIDPPPLSQCDPHPESVVQLSGSTFSWSNDFSPGHGRVSGRCGGAGKENMFRLQATYPGNVYIDAFGSGGYRPVVNVRRGCGGTTELACNSEVDLGSPGAASLSYFLDTPGDYYVVVDSLSVDGGAYSLEVFFD
jgi:hypothetical protein